MESQLGAPPAMFGGGGACVMASPMSRETTVSRERPSRLQQLQQARSPPSAVATVDGVAGASAPAVAILQEADDVSAAEDKNGKYEEDFESMILGAFSQAQSKLFQNLLTYYSLL